MIEALGGCDTGPFGVARWSDMAVGNVCPAEVLLPADVAENDRRNSCARVLRELLALEAFGLTPVQQAVYDELVEYLCQGQ